MNFTSEEIIQSILWNLGKLQTDYADQINKEEVWLELNHFDSTLQSVLDSLRDKEDN